MLNDQMTSLLTSCHIRHVCLHYKSVYLIVSDLPETMINKAVNDLRKRLNACVSADGGHFEHITWTKQSRLIWHYFVKVEHLWIKICNLAKIETYNRCVKNRLKILNRLWKNEKCHNLRGDFFDSQCTCIHHWKVRLMSYNSVADNTGLSLFV